jgi:hypothetical protein
MELDSELERRIIRVKKKTFKADLELPKELSLVEKC